MVKAEWGVKRSCPKCGTRFYDLGKDDPITCIECGTNFEPETVLKSKQPVAFEAAKPVKEKEEANSDLSDELELDVDEDEEPNADDDVDLGGDDDIGVATSDDEDEH